MSTRKLVVCITFLAVFAMAARISVDTDTWWHLRAGQWIVENRAIPRVDSFSHTRSGQPWEYPGWLVQAPLYLIYRWLGPGGLNLWTAAMVTLAFACIYPILHGGPFLRAFAVVLAAAASGVYWAARPYMVTFAAAAFFLLVLERWRRRMDTEPHDGHLGSLLLLPLVMLVWVNSHGGFAAGFLIWGAYLAGALFDGLRIRCWSSVRPLALTGALLLAAASLNPSGPEMLAYPFKTVGITAVQEYIQEWQPPDLQARSVQPFIWLLLLTFGAVGFSRRRLLLTDFLLFAGFGYMALTAGRNIALFSLAAPLVLTRHADPLARALGQRWGYSGLSERPRTPFQGRLNLALLALLAAAGVLKLALVFPAEVNQEHFAETLPVEAVDFLRSQPHSSGKLFNSYNYGGYLVWALPEYPVFVDGRTDLYNDEIISQWLQVVRAEPGWQDVLDRWEIGVVLLEPDMPVVSELESSGWERAYADSLAVIYRR
ncbi:MAG: hypothetical protein GX495_00530 [Chloroflexi bacterium]|jgi:hypothetical protein|nr:hypothetical protein [Chloroflexota bacterium]